MDNKIDVRVALNDAILLGIQDLADLEPGSEDHERAVKDVCSLTDALVAYKKQNSESEELEIRREMDSEKTDSENEISKLQTYVDAGKTTLTVVSGLISSWYWLRKSFEFEKDGAITNSITKELIKKIVPKTK
jgi:hypothetical protein